MIIPIEILIVGMLSLIMRFMEIIRIKNVIGEFTVKDTKTSFKIQADAVRMGFFDINVVDIILTINLRKKLKQYIQGDIVKRNDNNSIVISSGAHNFDHINFNFDKKYLKLLGSYFYVEQQFQNRVLEGELEIKTDPNIVERLFTWPISYFINKKKYKFKLKKVDKIKRYDEFESLLLDEEIFT